MRDEQFPASEFEAAGYTAVTHGQKSWNGVAVLAREPMDVRQVGLPGQEDFGSRLLTVDVGGLSFTTVYVPNGKDLDHPDFERKLEWLGALGKHFREHHDSTTPTILCGDFNVVPESIDSWDGDRLAGTIFHTEPERARIAYFQQWGLLRSLPQAPSIREDILVVGLSGRLLLSKPRSSNRFPTRYRSHIGETSGGLD